ncbi:hypothetical protein PPL_06036 [Heterostelium album PN500]|uniref:valine--tRNA ligase n=1 Tax=Heterostelium pallidum (strain ATCC 26659 / Pp 5 / PN500) TaxID=670386 RepID=D3BC16_HETP5|nr:hypothetical protein PPL_06036 [Heterostelium album PN500]EFA81199.1 hypothetical protein PPL_06036 [Heterostelium album PN500]|eukprot:XP_020433317.1 hypothetical protein PPL_06036 [Heterostelium album PN500]
MIRLTHRSIISSGNINYFKRNHNYLFRSFVSKCPINNDALKSSYDPVTINMFTLITTVTKLTLTFMIKVIVESDKYKWWEDNHLFKPREATIKRNDDDNDDSGSNRYSMVLPPPNVTGSLHIGHALTTTIEDALVRFKRMSGYETLWIPGLDHSGIATQVVVEKELKSKQNLTRHQLGREKFLAEVHKWTDKYSENINNQLRKTGASLDWSRSVFTLDKQRSEAVETAFLHFYRSGLVYRATRLVNWCPELRSVISDIEVDHESFEKPRHYKIKSRAKSYEFGVIHDIAYRVAKDTADNNNNQESLIVSTTRPETLFGDTAIAVHPDDKRYQHLRGKSVVHPFTGELLPIVFDSILVDPTLGSGAVKVTPAHDFNDYECGKRHQLPSLSIMNEDGKLNQNVPLEFQGVDRLDARELVIKKLKEMNLYIAKKPHPTTLSICSRTGDIIEPVLRPQWYVNCQQLGKQALELVESGKIQIVPLQYKDNWSRWLSNIQDWCISRQLWWGHPIPAYKVILNNQSTAEDQEKWVVGESIQVAMESAMKEYNLARDSFTLERDEDVLDTWFSSGLFPISALGWPSQNKDTVVDLSKFYPLDVMETGSDILFFWVARMVMMCTAITGVAPFKTILLHPLIRDSQGRKMSKSLGNVIDPLHVINGVSLEQLKEGVTNSNLSENEKTTAIKGLTKEFPQGIPKCGTDSLRIALSQFPIAGKDINLDMSRIIGQRLFCNKIWNASKLVLMYTNNIVSKNSFIYQNQIQSTDQLPFRMDSISIIDMWILKKLASLVQLVKESYDSHNLSQASQSLYSFFQYEYCDFYLEMSKLALNRKERRLNNADTPIIMLNTLECFLRLLHPFMPYLTEDIWQRLPKLETEPISIMIANYPLPTHYHHQLLLSTNIESIVNLIQSTIHSTRSIRTSHNITNQIKINLIVQIQQSEQSDSIISSFKQLEEEISKLLNCQMTLTTDAVTTGDGLTIKHIVSEECTLWIQYERPKSEQQDLSALLNKKNKLVESIKDLEEAK